MLKKSLCFVLSLVLSLGCIVPTVGAVSAEDMEDVVVAEEVEEVESSEEVESVEVDLSDYLYMCGGRPEESATLFSSVAAWDTEELEQAIFNAMYNLEESLDIYSFNIPYSDENILKLDLVVAHVINSNPCLFYVTENFTYYFDSSQLISLRFYYCYEAFDDLPVAKVQYEEAVDVILEGARDLSSDFDKVLFLHNWIIVTSVYDSDAGSDDFSFGYYRRTRSAYGALVDGLAVCSGYSLAFADLCKRLGIAVGFAVGPSHIWNMVKIDGNWYNVDVTFDQCSGYGCGSYDTQGYLFGVSNKYFLVSTDKLVSLDNTAHTTDSRSVYDYEATSTSFDDCWLFDVETAVWPNSAGYLYLDKSSDYTALYLVERSFAGVETILYSDDAIYPDGGTDYIISGMKNGIVCRDGLYYFNSLQEIVCYNPSTGNLSAVADSTPEYISGLALRGNTLLYLEIANLYATPEVYILDLDTLSSRPDDLSDVELPSSGSLTLKQAMLLCEQILSGTLEQDIVFVVTQYHSSLDSSSEAIADYATKHGVIAYVYYNDVEGKLDFWDVVNSGENYYSTITYPLVFACNSSTDVFCLHDAVTSTSIVQSIMESAGILGEELQIYSISFDSAGGSSDIATAVTIDGKLTSLDVPILNGNIFGGWYLGDERVTTQTVFTEDASVTARWIPIETGVVGDWYTLVNLYDRVESLQALLGSRIPASLNVYFNSQLTPTTTGTGVASVLYKTVLSGVETIAQRHADEYSLDESTVYQGLCDYVDSMDFSTLIHTSDWVSLLEQDVQNYG